MAEDGGMLVMVEVARMNLGNLFFWGSSGEDKEVPYINRRQVRNG